MSRLRTVAGALTVAGILAVGTIAGYETYGGKPDLNAYRDVVGIPTACFGETLGIKMGMKFTVEECERKFVVRLDEFANAVEKCAPRVRELSDRSYVQFVSVAYNIGTGGFCKSTMKRRIQAGDFRGACEALLMWDKAGGRKIKGLTKRRQAERADCIAGLSETTITENRAENPAEIEVAVAPVEPPKPVPSPVPPPLVVPPVASEPAVPDVVVVDTPESNPAWLFFGFALVVVSGIAGFIWYKKKRDHL